MCQFDGNKMGNRYDSMMTRLSARPVYKETFVNLDEAELLAVEATLGFRLPGDYREFLAKYGVCYSDEDHRIMTEDRETSVDLFYGVEPDDEYDITEIKDLYGERLESHMVPIASSSGGEICMSLGEQDYGSIYWWDPHDEAAPASLLAESFDAFVNSLGLVSGDESE